MSSRRGNRSNPMSLKEILFIVFGTLLFLGVIFCAAAWFLVYGHLPEGTPTPDIACSKEDFTGLCGVRKFLEGERKEVE